MGRESEDELGTSTDDEEDSIRELENELYSVVYYTGLNENIADDVQGKYNIKKENNELIISLKLPEETSKTSQLDDDKLVNSPCENETEIIIKTRCSNNDKSRNNLLKRKRQDDSSDSDSDCLIIEPEDSEKANVNNNLKKRKRSSSKTKESYQIPVVTLSDDSDSDSVIMNIDQPKECLIVSDSETETHWNDWSSDFKLTKSNWKDISSPDSWTLKMRKYYNAPSEKLRTFDDDKMRKEMRAKGSNWFIIDLDRFPSNIPRPRCSRCRGRGHIARDCPMRRKNCHMCGFPGHYEGDCPGRMCLNCGAMSSTFVSMCSQCFSYRQYQYQCKVCRKRGHHEEVCPDTWRRFHNTIDGPLLQTSINLEKVKHCCNCGGKGHLFEHCPKLYWTIFPKAYSVVTNYGDNPMAKETIVKRLYLTKDEKLNSQAFYEIIRKYQETGVEIFSCLNLPLPYLEVKGAASKIWQLQNDVQKLIEPTINSSRPVVRPPKKKKKKVFWRKKKVS